MELRYERINMSNLALAARVEYQIFPNASAYTKYLNEAEIKGDDLPINYIVFEGENPVGVVGLYLIPEYEDTIWLSYFGVLETYRYKGYGSQILEDIIEKAKKYGRDFLRLYTYEVWNHEAQEFYKKKMHIGEYYKNERENQFFINVGKPKIFGYSLSGKPIDKWNDKFVDISSEDVEHEKSIELMKKEGII